MHVNDSIRLEEIIMSLRVKFALLQTISGEEGKKQIRNFLSELVETEERYPLD